MTTHKQEVAFIDANVADLDQLVAGLREGVMPLVLHAGRPATEQMARALEGMSDLNAVHIIAHGQAGEIRFSAGALKRDNLDDHADALRAIGLALAEDGVVQVYACETAEGEAGRAFIQALSEQVGAEVFASAHKVGTETLGGRWDLVSMNGHTHFNMPFTPEATAAYSHVLAISIDLSEETDTGSSNDDGITKLTTFTIAGVGGTALNYVIFTIGATTYSPVLIGPGGSFTFSVTLPEGAYTISAQEWNSTLSVTVGDVATTQVTVDTTAPAASGTAPDLVDGSDSGTSDTDNLTNNTTPTFTGSGVEANATVTLYDTDGTTVLGTALADGGGNWSITSSTLSEGAHSLTVKQTDLAGNTSTVVSYNMIATIDTIAPTTGTLAFSSLSDTGSSDSDGITQDDTFNLSLTGQESGATVVYQVTTDGGMTWTTTSNIQNSLTDGAYQFRAKVTDAAGNTAYTAVIQTTVDKTVAAPSFALNADTGSNGSDGITNNGQVDVTLAADVATWEYSTDGGTNWTTGTGTSFTLAEGAYAANAVQVRQTDVAGNTSAAASNAAAITIDATVAAPSFALNADTGSNGSDGITNNGQVDVTLAADVATWEYSTDGGTNWTTGTGNSFTLAEGAYAANAVQVRQTDVAGNTSAARQQRRRHHHRRHRGRPQLRPERRHRQ
jgi:hypothetical protein